MGRNRWARRWKEKRWFLGRRDRFWGGETNLGRRDKSWGGGTKVGRRDKGGEVEEGRWGRIWIVGAGWGPREPIATHTHYIEQVRRNRWAGTWKEKRWDSGRRDKIRGGGTTLWRRDKIRGGGTKLGVEGQN